MHCGIEDGTTVAAHSNSAIHGHGRGIKSHDCFVAFLCFTCHRYLDQGWATQGTNAREEKLEFFRRAMEKTFLTLWREGKINVS
jgi:hypothetical protein